MKIARVVAHVVSTQKHPFYHGLKSFLVKPLTPDRRDPAQWPDEGTTFVAVDRVQAGIGDLVLLMQEGSSARFMFDDIEAPARSVIVGIVDHVELQT